MVRADLALTCRHRASVARRIRPRSSTDRHLQQIFIEPRLFGPGVPSDWKQRLTRRLVMMWWHDGMGWGGWIVMTLTMLAFWSLVVFGVVAIFRDDRENRRARTPRDQDPSRILDERFARGDIDVDEYRLRQDALRAAR
jgi:putative membrane protein